MAEEQPIDKVRGYLSKASKSYLKAEFFDHCKKLSNEYNVAPRTAISLAVDKDPERARKAFGTTDSETIYNLALQDFYRREFAIFAESIAFGYTMVKTKEVEGIKIHTRFILQDFKKADIFKNYDELRSSIIQLANARDYISHPECNLAIPPEKLQDLVKDFQEQMTKFANERINRKRAVTGKEALTEPIKCILGQNVLTEASDVPAEKLFSRAEEINIINGGQFVIVANNKVIEYRLNHNELGWDTDYTASLVQTRMELAHNKPSFNIGNYDDYKKFDESFSAILNSDGVEDSKLIQYWQVLFREQSSKEGAGWLASIIARLENGGLGQNSKA